MVASFLPVLNLLNQFLKQISKPVSFRIVEYAKTHPAFRQYLLVSPGRWFHTLDQRVRRKLLIKTADENEKSKKDQRVDDETAIDAGANLMSECLIFLIAGLGVTAEVYRSARNSAAKEAIKVKEMKDLTEKKDAVSATVEKQTAVINELGKLLSECVSLHTSTCTGAPEKPEK